LKLEQEEGHDQFALDDLRALGYDAEPLVRSVPPVPSVAALVDFGRACVNGPDPATFLGYIYALERRVLRLTDEWFQSLAKSLPAGAPVATGLRAHAREFDREHVEEAIAFIAALPAADRAGIARACHRATEISCAPLENEFPPEGELESWLGRYTGQQRGVRT
jgi:pyrroloquinoline quinone (PQQ) biosynthesis protein C